MDIIQGIFGANNVSNEDRFDFSFLYTIEANQNYIKDKITNPNAQIEPPDHLNTNEKVNENEKFNSNDRNNEIQLIVPFIGKKRYRKGFKKKRSSAS